ncbi:MAG: ferrous iron transport protein A [Clostridia bacterium]|nr:ferrous iron transport protein A [Clostridia bacterium]
MDSLIPLHALKPGQRAVIRRLDTPEPLRRRLLELGLLPGEAIGCIGRSPGGDPSAYELCHAVVAIRRQDAAKIWIFTGEGNTSGTDE